jgi:hypothetical protein
VVPNPVLNFLWSQTCYLTFCVNDPGHRGPWTNPLVNFDVNDSGCHPGLKPARVVNFNINDPGHAGPWANLLVDFYVNNFQS